MSKFFTRATLGLAAAGLAVFGVAVAPQLGSAAPAKATTHTLKLNAHQTANHNFPPNKFAGAETDRSPATGAVRGYDVIRGSFNLTTQVVKIDAAVALKGGLITAHLVGASNSKALDGIITGGTGKYKGEGSAVGLKCLIERLFLLALRPAYEGRERRFRRPCIAGDRRAVTRLVHGFYRRCPGYRGRQCRQPNC